MSPKDEIRSKRSEKTNAKRPAASLKGKSFSTDRDILNKEVIIHTFRASGPGGQHRNVTDSGVRIVHEPSGLVVTATESRSQRRNKEKAFERLIANLNDRNRIEKPRIPTRKKAGARERELNEKHMVQQKKRLREKPELDE